jgi:hypothetical protein
MASPTDMVMATKVLLGKLMEMLEIRSLLTTTLINYLRQPIYPKRAIRR